jgi:hypothetical protein
MDPTMVHAGLEDPSWNKKRGERRGCAESNAISRLAASSGERAVQEGGWMDVFFFPPFCPGFNSIPNTVYSPGKVGFIPK